MRSSETPWRDDEQRDRALGAVHRVALREVRVARAVTSANTSQPSAPWTSVTGRRIT